SAELLDQTEASFRGVVAGGGFRVTVDDRHVEAVYQRKVARECLLKFLLHAKDEHLFSERLNLVKAMQEPRQLTGTLKDHASVGGIAGRANAATCEQIGVQRNSAEIP